MLFEGDGVLREFGKWIQYNTIQYNTIQYNTIQYNTIQYNTIQYNAIQYTIQHYRVIALISVNIVPSWDIEGRELASVRRYHNEGQYSPISVR